MSNPKSQIYIDERGRIYERQPRQWPLAVILSVTLLVFAVVSSIVWLNYMVDSARNYDPPITSFSQNGRATTPIVQQVVLVIVDGLRVDAARQMPLLGELRARGAFAVARVTEPTLSPADWTTLVTGAGPELSGAPLLNVSADKLRPMAVDNLFQRANQMSLATGLIGYYTWETLIPAEQRAVSFFTDTADAPGDTQITEAAVRALKAVSVDLLVVHFSRVDSAGHEHGATSAEYFDAILAADRHLREITSALDLSRSVLIVTSDHGHLDQGGHGGPEPEVATAPFVMVGQGVLSGEFGTIEQTDIAPTIAALLGTAIPAAAQGAPRFEMLKISDALRAEKALASAEHHLSLAQSYLEIFPGGELERVIEDEQEALRIAQTTNELGSHIDAFKLAFPTVTVVNETLAQLRADRIAAEQSRRLPVLAVGLVPFAILWIRRSFRTGWQFVTAFLTVIFPLGNAAMWASLGGIAMTAGALGERLATALLLAGLCMLAYRWWQGDRRSGQLVALLLLATLTLTVHYGFFARLSAIYSPSAIRDEGALLRDILGRSVMALSFGSAITLAGLWWEDDVQFWTTIRATYGFVLLVISMLGASLAVTAWQMGFGPTWYVPDAKLLLLQLSLLAEIGFVAGIGLILPVFTVAVGYGLYVFSRRVYLSPASRRA